MRVSLPDKRTASGKRTKTGGDLWATSLVRSCFLWTSSLTVKAHIKP